ncbi:MAG: P-type DNA transfer ATPase VirB11, partial [Sphingorhabdus sp.]
MSIEPDPKEFGAIYLQSFLEPLRHWLNATDVTEILINRPGEIWVERNGHATMERHEAPALDGNLLTRLSHQIARSSFQGINRESPLLSATLPDGIRVQIIAPPATRDGIAVAFRKHVLNDIDVRQFLAQTAIARRSSADEDRQHMRNLAANGDVALLLDFAVAKRKTVLISGGTSSGKTTLLNALLKEIPLSERLVVIEDTPELHLAHPNAIGLVAVSGNQGEAKVTTDDLMRASLRMRPDRLIVGELRGTEVATFLRAINTGHPGSFASIHASSTQGALEQLALMCLQAGLGLSREDTLSYTRTMIDVVIQLRRDSGQRFFE